MSANPCYDCKKKRYGCYCKKFSAWLDDDAPLKPILEKKPAVPYRMRQQIAQLSGKVKK